MKISPFLKKLRPSSMMLWNTIQKIHLVSNDGVGDDNQDTSKDQDKNNLNDDNDDDNYNNNNDDDSGVVTSLSLINSSKVINTPKSGRTKD